jgi:hypothetical protein
LAVEIEAALHADCPLLRHRPTHVAKELFEGWFEGRGRRGPWRGTWLGTWNRLLFLLFLLPLPHRLDNRLKDG